jgi:hypothetical protein
MEEGTTFRYPMGPAGRSEDPVGTGRQIRFATSLWNATNVIERREGINTKDGEAAVFGDLPG